MLSMNKELTDGLVLLEAGRSTRMQGKIPQHSFRHRGRLLAKLPSSRRYTNIFKLTLFTAALLLCLYNASAIGQSILTVVDTLTQWLSPAPSFQRFINYEDALPQHNASLPFPEGRNGRYVWVSSQHEGVYHRCLQSA